MRTRTSFCCLDKGNQTNQTDWRSSSQTSLSQPCPERIDDEIVVLDPATIIEEVGVMSEDIPQTEDPLPSPLVISHGAVESIGWPKWVDAPIRLRG